MDYWREYIEVALADAGLAATEQQIKEIAWAVEGAHENHGMAHGYHAIPNPLEQPLAEANRQLRLERDKRVCAECRGRGEIVTHGPAHSAISTCYKCRGEGKA